MKKLLLIQPATINKSSGYAETKAFGIPPLGLGYVAALTPEHWQVKIIDEHVEEIIFDEKYDLVGITAYSLNAPRAYQLAREFNKRGIATVLGGIHVSMVPDEAANYADSIVVGEAESVWGKVIDDFENNKLQKKYIAERLPLDNLPLPRRDLFSDKYEMDVIHTSRGCPFKCNFCSVTAFNGNEYRQRPIEEVLNEMQMIKKDFFYIVDDNILGFGKEHERRALKLFKGMLEKKINKIWATQASINFADSEEVLEYAYKSGCRSVYIGFESINFSSLKEMRKGINIKAGIEGFKRAVKKIHKHGISVVGAFIVGNDHDSEETFKNLYDFMKDVKLDVLSIAYLTPLPGTGVFDRLKQEKRIIYDNFPEDWEKYDTDQIVIKPKNMSVNTVVRGYQYLVEKRFAKNEMLKQAITTFFSTKSIVTALVAYNLNKGTWEFLIRDRNFDLINN